MLTPRSDNSNFKNALYERYRSTHVGHRKPVPTPDWLERRTRVWQRHFGDLIPADRNASILDVGCGEGAFLWWLGRLGYGRAEGIELSPEEVEIAKGIGVRAERADLWEVVGGASRTFDLILYRNVLEHFERPEILELLARTRRSLSSAGRIIIQVPNGESPFFGRIRYGDFTHELAFTRASITQVLLTAGFENVRVFPVPPVAETLKGRLRMPLWKLVELFYTLLLFAEVGRDRGVVTLDLIAVADAPAGANAR